MSTQYQNELLASKFSAAIVISNAFLGTIPASEEKLFSLAAAAEAQKAAYAAAGVALPALGPYEAFGKDFALANPSKVTGDADAVYASFYQQAFGVAATQSQIEHFKMQEAYLKGLYEAAGLADAAVQARGAAIGQLIGYAVLDPDNIGTPTEKILQNFYADYADGQVVFGQPGTAYQPPVKEVIKEVPVPGPTVIVDKPDVIAKTMATLDAKYAAANGNLPFGDQTTPASGQSQVLDPTSGGLVAISLVPRQTNDGLKYMPVSSSFDGVTLTVGYTAPAGPQSTANGSFADVANRGATNTTVTFGADDIKAFLAKGFVLEQAFDRDNTSAVDHATFRAYVAQDGTIDFQLVGGPVGVGINDSTTLVNSVGNSQQQNFYATGGVAALTEGAQFSNSFSIYDSAGVKLAGIVENITLGPAGFAPADQLT